MIWNSIFESNQDYFSLLGLIAMIFYNLHYKNEIASIKTGCIEWFDTYFKKPKKILHKKSKKRKDDTYSEKSVFYYVLMMTLIQFISGGIMNRVVGEVTGVDKYNYFGFAVFAPLIFFGVCKLVKTNALQTMDIFAPAYPLSLIFFKLGCYVTGCCSGCEVSFSFLYLSGFKNKFPSQLLEALVALIIFFVLVKIRKKVPQGTLTPLYLIMYSATRFITEFTRHEPNTVLFLKTYQIFCLAGLVIGIIEYLIVCKKIGAASLS